MDEDTAITVGADGSDRRKTTREAIAQALNAVDERAWELAIDAAVLPDGLSDRTAAALRGLPRDVARRSLRQLAWVNVMHTRPGLDGVRYQSLDPVREALGPESTQEHELAVDRERVRSKPPSWRLRRTPLCPMSSQCSTPRRTNMRTFGSC